MYKLKRTPNGSVIFNGFFDFLVFFVITYWRRYINTYSYALIGYLLGSTFTILTSADGLTWKKFGIHSALFFTIVAVVSLVVLGDAHHSWKKLVRMSKKEDNGWNKVI